MRHAPVQTKLDPSRPVPRAPIEHGAPPIRLSDRAVPTICGFRGASIPAYPSGVMLQRKCACGGSAGPAGKCADCADERHTTLQRQSKLAINEPGDQFEREADAVADQVVGAAQPIAVSGHIHKPVLLRRGGDGSLPTNVPPVVHDVLRSSGRPLDPATRAFMEPRFGCDFGGVRIHTDAKAASSASEVAAHAYTVGRDIVFAADQYRPGTTAGRHLLAHELSHVVQQSGGTAQVQRAADGAPEVADRVWRTPLLQHSPVSLQRKEDNCSGVGATCASAEECMEPDPGYAGDAQTSHTWNLLVNIDVESSSFYSGLASGDVGHTYVVFTEGNGRRYSYGFYPAGVTPNENRRSVPGCVHHPDDTHARCIDDTVRYSLTQAQYNAALGEAQRICRDRATYGVAYTCTTYAANIARAAGQSLPSSTSQPMELYYQNVPPIDNPNTLMENVEAERQRDPNRRSPIWNDPRTNQCEADFNSCLRAPSRTRDAMRGMHCIVLRDRCYRRASGRER